MSRRVLVTGATGVLGAWLRRTAPSDVEMVGIARSTSPGADLLDAHAALRAVQELEAQAIIHAAYAIDRDSIVAMSAHVAAAAHACGVPLLHVSTEAVFSGDGRVRREDETPDPVWDYGRWKAESEELVLARVPDATVVRLPLLVSLDPPDGNVRMLRTAADQQGTVGWYDGEMRQPARAEDAAAGLWRILLRAPDRSGTWHLPGPEVLSRRDLGMRLESALDLQGISTSRPAPPHDLRPHDLRLSGARAEQAIDWAPAPVP